MSETPSTSGPRELAFRRAAKIAISLVWRQDDTFAVVVEDEAAGEVFEVKARRDNALDVFYHPYAYAPPAA
jgi:hypothetical protein